MIYFNFLQLCGFAAQQFINHAVQNHQQDWNDVIEGTIMLITREQNTGKTVFTVHSLKKGKGRRSVLSSQPSLYSRGQVENS